MLQHFSVHLKILLLLLLFMFLHNHNHNLFIEAEMCVCVCVGCTKFISSGWCDSDRGGCVAHTFCVYNTSERANSKRAPAKWGCWRSLYRSRKGLNRAICIIVIFNGCVHTTPYVALNNFCSGMFFVSDSILCAIVESLRKLAFGRATERSRWMLWEHIGTYICIVVFNAVVAVV